MFSAKITVLTGLIKSSYSQRELASGIFRRIMPRLVINKPAWEVGLQGAVKEGRRGWSVANFRGKTRLRLQFPKQGSWPADAQMFLPYPLEPASVNPVIQLVNVIYSRFMSC